MRAHALALQWFYVAVRHDVQWWFRKHSTHWQAVNRLLMVSWSPPPTSSVTLTPLRLRPMTSARPMSHMQAAQGGAPSAPGTAERTGQEAGNHRLGQQ